MSLDDQVTVDMFCLNSSPKKAVFWSFRVILCVLGHYIWAFKAKRVNITTLYILKLENTGYNS